MKKIFLILLILFMPLMTHAELLDPDIQKCAADVAHSHRCFEQLNADYDRMINQNYQQLLKVIPGQYKQALIDTQNAWGTFRDADKSFTSLESASMQPLLCDISYAKLTKARNAQLKEYLNVWGSH